MKRENSKEIPIYFWLFSEKQKKNSSDLFRPVRKKNTSEKKRKKEKRKRKRGKK